MIKKPSLTNSALTMGLNNLVILVSPGVQRNGWDDPWDLIPVSRETLGREVTEMIRGSRHYMHTAFEARGIFLSIFKEFN